MNDQYGRCVICGRRGSHCEDCHRGHDYAWNVDWHQDEYGRWRDQRGRWLSEALLVQPNPDG